MCPRATMSISGPTSPKSSLPAPPIEVEDPVVAEQSGESDPADAWTTAQGKWSQAKAEFFCAGGMSVFGGLAWTDLQHGIVPGGEVASAAVLVAAGIGTTAVLGTAVKDAGEAAVWAVIAGVRHLTAPNRQGDDPPVDDPPVDDPPE